jgi:hypothetical protein
LVLVNAMAVTGNELGLHGTTDGSQLRDGKLELRYRDHVVKKA